MSSVPNHLSRSTVDKSSADPPNHYRAHAIPQQAFYAIRSTAGQRNERYRSSTSATRSEQQASEVQYERIFDPIGGTWTKKVIPSSVSRSATNSVTPQSMSSGSAGNNHVDRDSVRFTAGNKKRPLDLTEDDKGESSQLGPDRHRVRTETFHPPSRSNSYDRTRPFAKPQPVPSPSLRRPVPRPAASSRPSPSGVKSDADMAYLSLFGTPSNDSRSPSNHHQQSPSVQNFRTVVKPKQAFVESDEEDDFPVREQTPLFVSATPTLAPRSGIGKDDNHKSARPQKPITSTNQSKNDTNTRDFTLEEMQFKGTTPEIAPSGSSSTGPSQHHKAEMAKSGGDGSHRLTAQKGPRPVSTGQTSVSKSFRRPNATKQQASRSSIGGIPSKPAPGRISEDDASATITNDHGPKPASHSRNNAPTVTPARENTTRTSIPQRKEEEHSRDQDNGESERSSGESSGQSSDEVARVPFSSRPGPPSKDGPGEVQVRAEMAKKSDMALPSHSTTSRAGPPAIPTRFDPKRPFVSTKSIEMHAAAGAGRNIAGRSTSNGFTFNTTTEEIPPTKRDGPLSLRHATGQNDENNEEQADTDAARAERVHSPDTASFASRKTPDLAYRRRMVELGFPKDSDTEDDYIRRAAWKNVYARAIGDRLNSHFKLQHPSDRWTATKVRDRAKALTGVTLELRGPNGRPTKSAKEGKVEGTKKSKRVDDGDDEVMEISPQRADHLKPPGDEKIQGSRATVGGKRPSENWTDKYWNELFGQASEDEDEDGADMASEEHHYQIASPDEGTTEVVRRPVKVYTVHQAVMKESEIDADADDAERQEILHAAAEQLGTFASRADAEARAFKAVAEAVGMDFELRTSTSKDDMRQWEIATGLVRVKAWVTVEAVMRSEVKLEKRALIRPAKVWEIVETVEVSWPEPAETKGSTTRTNDNARLEGEAESNDKSKQDDQGNETPTNELDEKQRIDDLFGDLETDLDNDQDMGGDLVGESDPAPAIASNKQTPTPPQPPAAPTTTTTTAAANTTNTTTAAAAAAAAPSPPRGPPLLLSRTAPDTHLYTTLQEANSRATRHILDRMILAQPPRTQNMDLLTLWRTRQTQLWNGQREFCNEGGMGVEHVVVVDGDADGDRPPLVPGWVVRAGGAGGGGGGGVEGPVRVWRIGVVERAVRGPIN